MASSSIAPAFNTKHNSWEAIFMHTSKCDHCPKGMHNTSVLQRCRICVRQVCKDCMANFSADGDHEGDVEDCEWDEAVEVKKERVARVSGKANTAQSQPLRRSTRVPKEKVVWPQAPVAVKKRKVQEAATEESELKKLRTNDIKPVPVSPPPKVILKYKDSMFNKEKNPAKETPKDLMTMEGRKMENGPKELPNQKLVAENVTIAKKIAPKKILPAQKVARTNLFKGKQAAIKKLATEQATIRQPITEQVPIIVPSSLGRFPATTFIPYVFVPDPNKQVPDKFKGRFVPKYHIALPSSERWQQMDVAETAEETEERIALEKALQTQKEEDKAERAKKLAAFREQCEKEWYTNTTIQQYVEEGRVKSAKELFEYAKLGIEAKMGL